ncbi:HTH domain-containing protein [Pseudofrancisella aestuarii]|uniref:HTH domain-containing protein n=1 Tax=Pseudofrancisella aestuarii TaxID=2670347 RepID=A0ABV9TBI1_9GAMM|nr:HTH domain-containing protein [Pseudofrancisella aestuarii]
MKIPREKELAIKRAIIQCIEKNESAAKLADDLGISKSTIYKYRKALVDQGFLIKESDGSFSTVENKYSTKQSKKPKMHTLDLSFNESPESDLEETPKENIEETPKENIEETLKREEVELIIKEDFSRLETIDSEFDNENTGLIKKIFNKFRRS